MSLELTKAEARAVKTLVERNADSHTIFETNGVRPTVGMRLLQAKLISLAAQNLGDEWEVKP